MHLKHLNGKMTINKHDKDNLEKVNRLLNAKTVYVHIWEREREINSALDGKMTYSENLGLILKNLNKRIYQDV